MLALIIVCLGLLIPTVALAAGPSYCSAGGIAASGVILRTQTRLFEALYAREGGYGDLVSRPLDAHCDQRLAGCPRTWSAATQLAVMAASQRTIITANPQGSGEAFRHAELSAAQKAWLSPAQLAWLRGQHSLEGQGLRSRASTLGAIVHSTPVVVGPPDRLRYPLDWDDRLQAGNQRTIEDRAALPYRADGDKDFLHRYAGRPAVVYVGANDGMLHGFAAASGEELLAFVPAALIPRLAALTDPAFAGGPYVDATPVVVDAVIDRGNGPQWRTVLVSGLGGGGRSVFALDITRPADFAEARANEIVLWEFRDAQLGLTHGRPAIVRLHHGRWAAVFGNGRAGVGAAALYVVDLSTGQLLRRIATAAGPGGANPAYGNALGGVFPADFDGDFITDSVYAGDLYGNLWRFDLMAANPADWRVAFGGKPLFTARAPGAGARQPITTAPRVAAHPLGPEYGVMAYVTTGWPDHDNAQATNSIYGIWDGQVFTADPSLAPHTGNRAPVTRTSLVLQAVLATHGDYRQITHRPVHYLAAQDTVARRGWALDLPAGEGFTSRALLRARVVAFTTRAAGQPPCGGSGFFMVVDAASGGATQFAVFDRNGDGRFTAADQKSGKAERIVLSGYAASAAAPLSPMLLLDYGPNMDVALLPLTDSRVLHLLINPGYPPQGRRSWRILR
ncbi:MAG: hypothetical protein L0H83_11690 [Salinisphaera sp.]|nr:hypothetical protein [Salinisphaera sp.]